MSYEIYKIVHLTGLVLLFSGLVSLLTLKSIGAPIEGRARKFSFISHGLGLFLLLLGGFGLLARMGIATSWPNWVYAKIAIWLYFGGMIALIKRRGQLGWILYLPLLLIFIMATYIVVYKPF